MLIYLGPAHEVGDVVVHVPSEGVLFAGDLLFNQSTPMDRVAPTSSSPTRWMRSSRWTRRPSSRATVGPVCGVEAVKEEQAYFQP